MHFTKLTNASTFYRLWKVYLSFLKKIGNIDFLIKKINTFESPMYRYIGKGLNHKLINLAHADMLN